MSGRKTTLTLEKRIRIGKKRVLYLPREILEAVGLHEGDLIIVRVKGERIVVERAPYPFFLAVKRRKWASTTVEGFEEESEQEDWKQ